MIFDLFAAGSETTSTTLQWIILYLIKYPDVQDLCRTEICRVNLNIYCSQPNTCEKYMQGLTSWSKKK